jgi:hypothetical protein
MALECDNKTGEKPEIFVYLFAVRLSLRENGGPF